MPLRFGVLRGERTLHQNVDHATVLRVHADEPAVLGGSRDRFEDRTVVDLKNAGVRHEQLERGDALFDHDVHFFEDFVRDVANDHVQAVVDRGLAAGLPQPRVARRLERLAHSLHREVDDRGGAAERRGDGTRIKVVRRERPTERELHVGMHVDATRDHVLACRVDTFRARRLEILPDHRDLLVLDEDIGLVRVGGGHDRPVGDERLPHVALPSLARGC